jgi:hypothetical protein
VTEGDQAIVERSRHRFQLAKIHGREIIPCRLGMTDPAGHQELVAPGELEPALHERGYRRSSARRAARRVNGMKVGFEFIERGCRQRLELPLIQRREVVARFIVSRPNWGAFGNVNSGYDGLLEPPVWECVGLAQGYRVD